jgi:hypothetical protein
MGWVLVGLIAAGLIWFGITLARQAFWPAAWLESSQVEVVDLIEGGCIVEQQRAGRERWRRAVVGLPTRPLTFEEQLNLRSIQETQNPNVRIKQ